MIPQQTFESYPVFGSNATKVMPDSGGAKYSNGFQQADVLPAEWMNWAWNKNSKGITDLNSGLASVEKEIIAVLTEYGIVPAEATEDQLKSVLLKMRPQICECSTAASTVAKSVSLTGNVLKAGNIYVITMTNGNTAANPTLSFNSGTAYPMCNADGVALGSGAWKAGDMITVIYTGTKYLMFTQAVTNKIENSNMNPVTSNAVSCVISDDPNPTVLTGPQLGVGANFKVLFKAAISASDTTTPLSLTYNGTSYTVKARKDGALVNVLGHETATNIYKYLQAYTTIEFVFDGTNLIIMGNPVLLSDTDYTIYSNGYIEYVTESGTGTTDNNGFSTVRFTNVHTKEPKSIVITAIAANYAFRICQVISNTVSSSLFQIQMANETGVPTSGGSFYWQAIW